MLELVPERKSYISALGCLQRTNPNDSSSAIYMPDLKESFIHSFIHSYFILPARVCDAYKMGLAPFSFVPLIDSAGQWGF